MVHLKELPCSGGDHHIKGAADKSATPLLLRSRALRFCQDFHDGTLAFFNFHCFNNIKFDMSSNSDKKSDGSDKSSSSKHKRVEEKEINSVVSPEKGPNKIEDKVLNVGNVVMPEGGVFDMNDGSAGLKSPPGLIGAPSSSKKFKLSDDEVYRATMVNQFKVRLLAIVTACACLIVHR